jgi:hypothetical protein
LTAGLGSYSANHLQTAHFSRSKTALDDYSAVVTPKFYKTGTVRMDLDAVYTDTTTEITNAVRGWNRGSTTRGPMFSLEGYYENDGITVNNDPPDIRRQIYRAFLTGQFGHVYGAAGVWCMGPHTHCAGSWTTNLNLPGAGQLVHARNAFDSRQWYNLVPDFSAGQSKLVVGGSLGWNDQASTNYIAGARSADNKLAMAYIPYSCAPNPVTTGPAPSCTATRQVTLNMNTMAAGTRMARWYNPTNAAYTPICGTGGKPACASGNVVFTTPGNNGANHNDWLLVIDVNTLTSSISAEHQPDQVRATG